MANKFKTEEPKSAKKPKNRVSKTLNALLNGEFLTREGVIKFMPFILFITGLFIAYIGIGYFFENTLRDHVRTSQELDELRSEFNTIQSQLEKKKQQSSVIHDINNLGLEEPETQPNIITVEPGYFEE